MDASDASDGERGRDRRNSRRGDEDLSDVDRPHDEHESRGQTGKNDREERQRGEAGTQRMGCAATTPGNLPTAPAMASPMNAPHTATSPPQTRPTNDGRASATLVIESSDLLWRTPGCVRRSR